MCAHYQEKLKYTFLLFVYFLSALINLLIITRTKQSRENEKSSTIAISIVVCLSNQ